MTKQILIRGLDSPQHLRQWMEAAGRQALVLRVADVLDMSVENQRLGIQIFNAAKLGTVAQDVIEAMSSDAFTVPLEPVELRRAIQNLGVNGYIRIPRDQICSLSIEDLQVAQQWLSAYRDVRLGKGEPSRVDPCEICRGTGKTAGSRCPECGGSGRITTFLEISPEEAALSEGAA
jgi:hypothetical protein